ncbi:hypothetical protein EK21DRAFT_96442 [Setomelanomma holmii]|uniref:Rhodopsin domain-containing protein n=1 Tax=Setomelanomma holmii TaxID=210430 RepID=A0A9P4LTI4_9PLEO|nr:hypothetical protein EK21DRAFT_96442 [Setomelanomma holmii]
MSMSVIFPEAAIFYGVCWIVVILRLISRRLHRGSWKGLQLDDYLILVAMCTDTVLIAMMSQVVQTSSNLIPPNESVSQYSQTEIDQRIYGSKLVLVVEQMQILTIWLIKTCLLLLYARMTTILPQHRIVIATSIYVAATFVIMEILYFGVWCRPFDQYWAVPTNSKQCSAATNHLITNAVFNISSDLIIISIPLPLLFRVRLPKKNKAALFTVFLIGAFTIVAAVLNKYYSFTNPFGSEWTIWYLRESYTALLCANLPLIYPLIQKVFRLRNWYSNNTYEGEADYRMNSRQPRTDSTRANSTREILSDSKPQPVHKGLRGSVRRTESQEIMAYDMTEEGGPHFITSAIDLEDMRSSGVSSTGTSSDWKPEEDSKKGFDPYRAV